MACEGLTSGKVAVRQPALVRARAKRVRSSDARLPTPMRLGPSPALNSVPGLPFVRAELTQVVAGHCRLALLPRLDRMDHGNCVPSEREPDE